MSSGPVKILIGLLVALALAACGATPAGPWVVEDRLYGRFPEQWSVTCVLASQLSKPYSQRGVRREIEVPKAVEETIQQGAPCPDGRLIDSY